MVSSTFTDLLEHRREVIDAIVKLGFHPVTMENSGARTDKDVIDASLEMVRDCSAYVLVISHKYGQTPGSADRNPRGLSITELEFEEAVRLGRPRLLFIMGDDHPVLPADVETNAAKRKKLKVFKERAKAMCPATRDSGVHCVYEVFSTKEALGKSATIAIAKHAIWLSEERASAGAASIEPAAFARMLEAVREVAQRQDVGTEALLALARRVAENVPDAASAIAELNRALDEFVQIRERAARGSNLGDLVEQTRRSIAAHNNQGDFDTGALEAEQALATLREREEELKAAKLSLIEAAIEQHRLRYDSTAMAHWICERIALNESALTPLALRSEIIAYREKARIKGLRLEMDVAIALARRAVKLAASDNELSRASNLLGIVTSDQGERAGGEEGQCLLGEAVEAYRAALAIDVTSDLRFDWAGVQNNLGAALQTQGERAGNEAGLRLLGEAVEAYRAALTVYTKANRPINWAATQNNLACTLQIQGERIKGEAGLRLLEESVEANRAALTVRTKADHAIEWARSQTNLGATLQLLGARTEGDAGLRLLGEAVEAFRAALTVSTKTERPIDWATTQNNFGIALHFQGARTGGIAGLRLLAEAIEAFRAALTVNTEADLSVQWAMTNENMALAFSKMADFDPRHARKHLSTAIVHVQNALRVYTLEHMPYDWGTASRLLERLQTKLAECDAE